VLVLLIFSYARSDDNALILLANPAVGDIIRILTSFLTTFLTAGILSIYILNIYYDPLYKIYVKFVLEINKELNYEPNKQLVIDSMKNI
jgi:hypothetical protein